MKKRIQTDNGILFFIIILTGVLYLFPQLYIKNHFFENVFDFLGLLILLKGTFFRMAARGYKKANSRKSDDLVTQGPYALTRNPMYLGSFLMGTGFILILWPFWLLPIFAYLFYLRFNKQILEEEAFLSKNFKEAYVQYCRNVPRLFPSLRKILEIDVRETFPWETAWSTNEKCGLFMWPILAVALEVFQERIIFGVIDLQRIVLVCAAAIAVFFIGLLLRYTLFPTITRHAQKSKTI